MIQLALDPHPLLECAAFTTELDRELGDAPSSPELIAKLTLDAEAPIERDEEVRKGIRDLLRHGGYKPTGRGKPASEYLVRAAGEGKLGSINLVVDACNVVSLASGLPISVVDLDRGHGPWRIGVAEAGTTYVFNASDQVIDVSGLLCLFDAEGPCANAVKDAQRTKTSETTRRTLSVVWAAKGMSDRLAAATAWYRELLHVSGAKTEIVSATLDIE
jgi:DNA/RNA-binding domain of Phe-tRNA-synthetase-like protein